MFGGLTASGSHTLAIRTLLLHRVPIQDGVIAAGGWDKVRFHRPVRPGDELWLEVTWVAKRRSTSKPDRGIVSVETRGYNQHGDEVLYFRRKVMVPKRGTIDEQPDRPEPKPSK